MVIVIAVAFISGFCAVLWLINNRQNNFCENLQVLCTSLWDRLWDSFKATIILIAHHLLQKYGSDLLDHVEILLVVRTVAIGWVFFAVICFWNDLRDMCSSSENWSILCTKLWAWFQVPITFIAHDLLDDTQIFYLEVAFCSVCCAVFCPWNDLYNTFSSCENMLALGKKLRAWFQVLIILIAHDCVHIYGSHWFDHLEIVYTVACSWVCFVLVLLRNDLCDVLSSIDETD